jgi:hypothetical protein
MERETLTKAQRRQLRELAGLAYERELGAAIEVLRQDIERCRAGQLNAFQVNELIHKYHDGVARKLWKLYAMGGNFECNVYSAIARGILLESEIDSGLLEYAKPWIERLRPGRT